MTDEYSESSDIYKRLTQSNIAIPLEQCFRADLTAMQHGSPGLVEAIGHFITHERKSEDYKRTRTEFGKGARMTLLHTILGGSSIVQGGLSLRNQECAYFRLITRIVYIIRIRIVGILWSTR